MQLTVREVAKIFQVSEHTIYRWIKERNLPAYRIHEQYRFNRAELLEWATTQKISFSPEILRLPEAKSSPLPSLTSALEWGGIFYKLKGSGKESVLKSVVDLLPLADRVDRKFLYSVLLAREALGSTGIGDGIAIPHPRNPIVLDVPQPTITLCFLENAVDFGALDDQPVRVLFTLISPTVQVHLHLLSRIAFALRHPEFKKPVLHQDAKENILKAASLVEARFGNLKVGEKERKA